MPANELEKSRTDLATSLNSADFRASQREHDADNRYSDDFDWNDFRAAPIILSAIPAKFSTLHVWHHEQWQVTVLSAT